MTNELDMLDVLVSSEVDDVATISAGYRFRRRNG
jgi:hypothetical protein